MVRTTFKKLFVSFLILLAISGAALGQSTMTKITEIIEIVSLKLKEGVTFEIFKAIDKAVELQHVSKQPGFISRQTAVGEDREWMVIVCRQSKKDAEASMSTFMDAPTASTFMENIDASTKVMKRYKAAKGG